MRLLVHGRGKRALLRGRGGEAAARRRDGCRGLGLTAEPRISYLVGRLDRLLRRRLGEALAPHGLSLAEYTTLSVLRSRTGLSNAQLARRALITPQSTNEVLARLEQRRLVRRRPDPGHGRVRPAALTAAGERLLRGADADVDVVERRMLADLSAADCSRLAELLASALANIRPPDN